MVNQFILACSRETAAAVTVMSHNTDETVRNSGTRNETGTAIIAVGLVTKGTSCIKEHLCTEMCSGHKEHISVYACFNLYLAYTYITFHYYSRHCIVRNINISFKFTYTRIPTTVNCEVRRLNRCYSNSKLQIFSASLRRTFFNITVNSPLINGFLGPKLPRTGKCCCQSKEGMFQLNLA